MKIAEVSNKVLLAIWATTMITILGMYWIYTGGMVDQETMVVIISAIAGLGVLSYFGKRVISSNDEIVE